MAEESDVLSRSTNNNDGGFQFSAGASGISTKLTGHYKQLVCPDSNRPAPCAASQQI
jgi:hypothetical protein